MKKRMKKLASLLLSVSMTFSMISFPVYATPADDTENETAVTAESPETEEPADATGETTEPVAEEQETTQPETTNPDTTEPETQPEVTPIEENYSTYTVRAEDIDVSGVTPHGVSVDEEVEVDEDDPVMSSIEEELKGMTVLNDEGESVALTPEQINTILSLWSDYQKQWKDNADVLGVQMPFFLSYNDEEDGLGVLGEMLVLARVPIDDVRTGAYSYDDLLGMIQNFYYADKFGIEYYSSAIKSARDEALEKVDESGAKTLVQKMLVLNDWIAHNATFDMSYIMQDEDGNPIMVAENPKKNDHYDEIHDAMYDLYEDQIRQQFRDKIAEGIKDAVYQQALEQAQAAHDDIYNQIYQSLLENGMEDNEETKALAEEQTQEQIEQIAQDAVDDVVENGMPATDEDGNAIVDEEGNQVRIPFETVIDNQMDQPLDDLGGMTPNEAIPVYAEQAATGLTEGIIGAWEGNHIGILAEGYGVCAGYAKAFAYLLQYMSPEQYGVNGAGTDMSVASNWKTAEDLYYDEDGNLDIDKDYVVDMVRITFDAETSMFGEESMFGEVHFWNAVKVDGTWYYVDPCYTDIYVECMSRDRVEIDGTMNHMYFMFSHSTALEMYDGNMEEIATLYADAAKDTSYEDSWLARVATNTYSDGTNFYYMYDSTDQLSMMREFQNMQNSGSEDFDESDFEALTEGSDPTYSIVYHPITDNDVMSGGADSDFTPLVEFNYKENEDDDTSVARVRNASGEMEENELLTELFAQYKEECDIYPSIKMTCALYNNKIYFNLSNCILSYDLSSCEIETVKVYDTVSGKRDNTIAFGGMAFSVCDESGADFTFENHPIAAMTIKDDGKMYVSVATNLGFISGKSAVDDTEHYGYAFEESNYNPDYSTYMQGFDIDDSQMEEMGYSEETNDNDEFMWSAVFVDKISMSGLCTSHTYESVTVEPTCGRDGYTENRCTNCGAVEAGSRVVNEGTACDHHYVHFYEQYYTKDDNGNWNSGDCYVCTVCGFAIEEPTEPTKNNQESDEEFEERQAEYEEEKAIYDHAVETTGHTYEATNADNVTWGEDSMTATVSGDVHCAVCEGRKLDALGANDYDPKASDNADNKVLTATLDSAVELTVEEDAKTVSGSCDSGLTINYTATGTAEDGKKIAAKKTETTEAGRHDYVATWTWSEIEEEEGEESEDTEAQSEETEIPYKATAKIECSVCHDAPTEELEGTVEVDEENSVAATCEEAGKTVYKATASYTKAEGEDPYTFETSDDELKVDEIPATGHTFADDEEHAVWTWSEDHKTATLVLKCTAGDLETDSIEATVKEKVVDATCTEEGTVTYTATATYEDKEYTDTQTVTSEALGHDYKETWDWKEAEGEEGHKATLTLTCSRCEETHTVDAKVELTNQKAATCTEDGADEYTATASYEDKEYTDVHKDEYKATGHTYADDAEHAAWTWTESTDGDSEAAYAASLVLTCTTCGTPTDALKADVTAESSDATCTEAGTTVYTAKVTYEGKDYTDSKTVTGEALGHNYEPKWTWTKVEDESAEIPYTAKVNLTCSRCDDKVEGIDATVVLKDRTEATCTEDGEIIYSATATYDGKDYNSEKSVAIKATGHEWGEWETVKEPTETEAGSRQRTCAKCGEVETEAIGTVERPNVQYRTHVQTYGWQEWVENGEMSGTSGESKRLEAIEIKLDNSSYSGSIEYSTHVQTYGWQDPVVDGALSGTSGESKRLEAIKINLTGDIANYYDVYYRVHAQTYGWLDWAKNGEVAGTAGLSKRLEGIEIVLAVKGEAAPGDTDRPYVTKEIGYSTHVQTYGWQATKYNGEVSGTSGESKRLEAIKINLVDPLYDGSIEYTTHVQTYGWQDYVSDGELSGTSGESKRLEAIRIRLKGDMADKYDVYYRVHAQNIGWMGWAKNGQAAGTAGYSYRLEAIQIILVKKGADAPGSTSNHFVQK